MTRCLRTAYALRGTETYQTRQLKIGPCLSEDCLRPTGTETRSASEFGIGSESLRTAYALRGTETCANASVFAVDTSLRTAYALRVTETCSSSQIWVVIFRLRTAYALRGTETCMTISSTVINTVSEDCLRPTGH